MTNSVIVCKWSRGRIKICDMHIAKLDNVYGEIDTDRFEIAQNSYIEIR